MLRKTKNQNMSDLFFGENELSKTAKEAEKNNNFKEDAGNRSIEKTIEEQKSKHLSGFDPMTSKNSSILSAQSGTIKDFGGPQKQLKTPSSNSIFDTEKIDRMAKTIGEVDKKQSGREEHQENRRVAEQKRMDDLVEALNTTDQRKANSVLSNSTGDEAKSKFKSSKTHISIFENSNFENLPEKTAGEKVRDDAEQRRNQKDESWKTSGKSFYSKDVVDRLFDNFFTKDD